MCSCHSILECCVTFSGVKLSIRSFVLLLLLLFEIVYGGWTLIRLKVLNKFRNCKSVPYSMLITLLDNYLPLSLSIYAVTFKLNKYLEYRKVVVRVWTMFLCFSQRHYNKTPLIWMQQLLYWQKTNPALYDIYRKYCFSRRVSS